MTRVKIMSRIHCMLCIPHEVPPRRSKQRHNCVLTYFANTMFFTVWPQFARRNSKPPHKNRHKNMNRMVSRRRSLSSHGLLVPHHQTPVCEWCISLNTPKLIMSGHETGVFQKSTENFVVSATAIVACRLFVSAAVKPHHTHYFPLTKRELSPIYTQVVQVSFEKAE